MCDNFFVDKNGDLWTGCHPIGYQAVLHLKEPKKYTAPSQVLKIANIEVKLFSNYGYIHKQTNIIIFGKKFGKIYI